MSLYLDSNSGPVIFILARSMAITFCSSESGSSVDLFVLDALFVLGALRFFSLLLVSDNRLLPDWTLAALASSGSLANFKQFRGRYHLIN